MVLPSDSNRRDTSSIIMNHAVDIFAFVEAEEIPLRCFETPYYLNPAPGEERDYYLLRETLNRTRKVAIAYVELGSRCHLAALFPCGPALILNILRWPATEGCPTVRNAHEGADLDDVRESEVQQAVQLVESMTKKWDVHQYHPAFRGDILSRVRSSVRQAMRTAIGRGRDDRLEDEISGDDTRTRAGFTRQALQQCEARQENAFGPTTSAAPARREWVRPRLKRFSPS